MQPELRPDRCHVVFSADDYIDGPYAADEPWLHAFVDPRWPHAWERGLPRLVIETFLAPRTLMRNGKPFEFPGGSVAVHVGSWWQTFHKGEIKSGFGEVDYGFAVGMFRRGDLPAGMDAPILDFDELMRRG